MRRAMTVGSIALSVGVAFACSGGLSNDDTPLDLDGGALDETGAGDGSGDDGATSSPGEGPAGTGLGTGLPCDVQALIENRCIACHSQANPPPLLRYSDLVAPSKSDPGKTMAQVALARMKS